MNLYELAEWYGNEMKKYGMSQYKETNNVPDPRVKLLQNELYKSLTPEQQEKLLEYGHEMKMYGMGMYAEHGACANYYNSRGGRPPENPFVNEMTNEAEPSKN